jgi:hypothetical protein
VIIFRGVGRGLGWDDWVTTEIPFGLHLLPFWILIGTAILAAVRFRDRLVLATWAAILLLTLANWIFAATGWAQFGYRYGLDAMPFIFLLVVLAVGRGPVRWHHIVLVAIAVLINLWGVLWIYLFHVEQLFGWTWVSY